MFMQKLKEELIEKITPLIQGEGMELVDFDLATYKAFLLLRFYVDKIGGVTVNECALLSRKISEYLDLEDMITGKYTLEVSSPGLDRPLTSSSDFKRKVGEEVEIFLKNPKEGKSSLQGAIKESSPDLLILESSEKKWEIPFSEIIKGKIIF
jgi:ribosome maturation factor RimP